MGLYDSWQLSNSRSVPQYQGSTIPELTKVADTLESRYDTGVQQADLLDQMAKTSTASTFDQPILNSLKQQTRAKLKDYADKGNYEDMWRNVAMDARDFGNKYKTIQGNQKAIQDWQGDLSKRVGEGKLDPAIAQARMAKIQDTYSGLKIDSDTGEMTNHFSGPATVPNVDIPEKVNKWLADSHAIERGWKAEQDVDGWYVTNGSEKKKLPWEKIKPIIDAGVALDPEVKAWLSQERELAPYYHGVSSKMRPDQVQQFLQSSPTMASYVEQKVTGKGLSPVQALHETLGDIQETQRKNQIYDYARKGIVDSETGEYSRKMDPLTEARLKKAQEQPNMFSVPFTDVSPGTTISNVRDFEGERGKAVTDLDNYQKQIDSFTNAPNVSLQLKDPNDETKGINVLRKEADGTLTDVTTDFEKMQRQKEALKGKIDQFDNIKKAAADETNYHPEQASPRLKAQGQQEAEDYKKAALAEASRVVENSRNGPVQTGTRIPSQDEVEAINKKAEEIRNRTVAENHPAYKDYEKALIQRLQPQGEGNKMFVFNADDPAKKTLTEVADAGISKLGLKDGLVSLKFASGKHMGEDIDADSYGDIQGKVDVVGVANDARTGDTKIVLRANQDIRGKKVKGENMILSMKDVGGLDTHLQQVMRPDDYHSLIMDRTLKSGLNNTAGTMNFPISDGNGANKGSVQITRKRGLNEGPGAFSMRIQTPSGFKSVSFDSYEGVIDAIKKLQAQYQ